MDTVDSVFETQLLRCNSQIDIPSFFEFPCLSPEHPELHCSDERFKTFPKDWCHEVSARELADAGFCYLGRQDRVYCFYCNGKLNRWESNDRPWFEHARWFPLCEFLLSKQSVSYVRNVCLKFPRLKRPKIKNACKSETVKSILAVILPEPKKTDPQEQERKYLMEEVEAVLCNDPSVQYAKKLGFSHKDIKNVITQRFLEKNSYFKNRDELLELLFDSTKEISLSERIKALELNSLCSVCRKNEKDAICLPCGHYALCWQCVQSLKFCYVCDCVISEKLRTYRS